MQALGMKLLLAFAGIFYFVLIFLLQPSSINTYDESVILAGALQFKSGLHPGSDFYSVYGPLQYIATSALIGVFNDNLLAIRLYHVATVTFTLLALASLITTQPRVLRAALVVLFLIIALSFSSDVAFPLYPTHLLSAFGAAFLLAKARGGAAASCARVLGLAGFIVLLVLLAPVTGVIITVMLFVAVPFDRLNKDDFSLNSIARGYGILMTATLVAAVLIGAYDVLTGRSLTALVQFLVDEQIPAYALHRNLPFPGLQSSFGLIRSAYFPLLIICFGGLFYLWTLTRKLRFSPSVRSHLFWLLFFCFAFYPSGIVRTHEAQLWPTFLFALASAFVLVGEFLERRAASRLLPVMLVAIAVFVGASKFLQLAPGHNKIAYDCSLEALTTPRTSCFYVRSPRTWETVARQVAFLNTFLADDEKFFSTNDRHDLIYSNDMSFYFLLDRLPITRWAHMEPGIQTTDAVQREIIGEIDNYVEANGRAVVLIQPSTISQEPNQSAVSSDVVILDQYLAQCEIVEEIGRLGIAVCQ